MIAPKAAMARLGAGLTEFVPEVFVANTELNKWYTIRMYVCMYVYIYIYIYIYIRVLLPGSLDRVGEVVARHAGEERGYGVIVINSISKCCCYYLLSLCY